MDSYDANVVHVGTYGATKATLSASSLIIYYVAIKPKNPQWWSSPSAGIKPC